MEAVKKDSVGKHLWRLVHVAVGGIVMSTLLLFYEAFVLSYMYDTLLKQYFPEMFEITFGVGVAIAAAICWLKLVTTSFSQATYFSKQSGTSTWDVFLMEGISLSFFLAIIWLIT